MKLIMRKLTFFPFLSEKATTDVQPPGPEDFLNKITFEVMEDLVIKLRALCLKYAEFSAIS